jgi:predicted metal-dependent peptidase
MAKPKSKQQKVDPKLANIWAAWEILGNHPLFFPLVYRPCGLPMPSHPIPKDGWAIVYENGWIENNDQRLAEPEEWVYVIAHCLLHMGFGHFNLPDGGKYKNESMKNRMAWHAACDVFVTRFLADLKLGQAPETHRHLPHLPAYPEERYYQRFLTEGIPEELRGFGTAGLDHPDMIFGLSKDGKAIDSRELGIEWIRLLGRGLTDAVSAAVNVAGGAQVSLSEEHDTRTLAQQARTWFVNSYPLLGSLAAAFKIIEDPLLCVRMQISVAAIDDELQEIYINRAAGMDMQETRFVMAHEMLHAGLRHRARCQGRNPYLWNVACDYVINGWLVEMGLGALPQFGGLYDAELKGLSAESVYDRIVIDLRRYRKLATLRGIGLGDMLESRAGKGELNGETLDDFYRRCLAQGLVYHQNAGRGDIPGGLVEEIQALGQPVIAWDVALARWFDDHFPPLEKIRTYARPSRRQMATPKIPRPSYKNLPGDAARTFGVILDTSGSMDRQLLAKALGAISSYSLARDVPFVRVVFCDAAAYDQGYLAPEDIAGRVKVKGRGGTVLQPGVDLLEHAEDFPKDGPLLVITDGWCDRVHLHREHAFLVPEGGHLPFIPRGEVFYIL